MIEDLAKRLTRSAGLDIRRVTPTSFPLRWVCGFAERAGVTTILDVGANEGQFAASILAADWGGKIVSFEPLSSAHAALSANAAKHANWTVAPRGAVGAERGETTINVAGNSQSSSLLPMLDRHLEAAPNSAYLKQEAISVVPLSELVADRPADERYMLKMDVQGFETEVLLGAASMLDRVPLIFSELSLQPLYQGEALFTELAQKIIDLGYRCVGLQPGFADPHTREMLQVDGLFVRN